MFGTATGSSTTPGGLFGTAPSFQFGATSTTPKPVFGAPAAATTTGGLFGSPFAPPAKSTPGGLFGSTAPATTTAVVGGGGLFGGTSTNVAASIGGLLKPGASGPLNPESLMAVAQAISHPHVFGDERDSILAKFNQLQAAFGTGKGAFANTSQPVDLTPENPFFRFKAVAFNLMAKHKNSEGLVGFSLNQKAELVRDKIQEFKDELFKILGSKANLSVEVDCVKPLPEDKCEVVMFVMETGATGLKRRIPARELASFLNQATYRSQLQSRLTVEHLAAKAQVDAKYLQEYLQAPPAGVSPLVWQEAQADNPDPDKLLPWPILGFQQLLQRQKAQIQESQLQHDYLKELEQRLSDLDGKRQELETRRRQCVAREQHLSHRLLRVVASELRRQRLGFAVDGAEEELLVRLQAIHARLNAPMQIKGRLGELLSVVRCQPELLCAPNSKMEVSGQASGSDEDLEEIGRYLNRFQEGLEKLVRLLQQDAHDLQIVQEMTVARTRRQDKHFY